MKRVNIHLAEADLAILDSQANSAGISRSEFLRSRVLNSINGKQYTPKQYQALISAAQRERSPDAGRNRTPRPGTRRPAAPGFLRAR